MNVPTAFLNYKWLTIVLQLNPLNWMIGVAIFDNSLQLACGPLVLSLKVVGD